MLLAMGYVFVFSELGHKLSTAFEDISDAIGSLNWYRFPVETWKALLTLISGAQEPAILTVFGSVSCTRADFKNVWK